MTLHLDKPWLTDLHGSPALFSKRNRGDEDGEGAERRGGRGNWSGYKTTTNEQKSKTLEVHDLLLSLKVSKA